MSERTLTTQQVEDGFAHEPEYEYHDPINYGAHVASNRRAFKRWLAEYTAERERAAAEKAWDEGRMQGVSDRDAATCEDAYWVVPITDNPYRLNEGGKDA